MTDKERIQKAIIEKECEIEELKKSLEAYSKMPDEVKDIPDVREMNLTGELVKLYYNAEMFLIRLLWFKHLYDSEYVPNWENREEEKWFPYFNYNTKGYHPEMTTHYKYCPVVFSCEEIADKCAEWLTYLYRKESE